MGKAKQSKAKKRKEKKRKEKQRKKAERKAAENMKVALFILVVAFVALPHAMAKRSWRSAKGDVVGTLAKGQDDPTGLCDTVKSEAGYFKIEGSKNKNYFYWFFESRNDPKNDPVILWMTGGPGCSSGVALFKENGPCAIDPENILETKLNPFGWNSNASI